jgi:hypothetical protein
MWRWRCIWCALDAHGEQTTFFLYNLPPKIIIIIIAPFAIDSYTRVRLAEKKNRRVYSLLARIVLLLLHFWRRGGRHPFLCLLKATALKRRTLNAFDLKEVSSCVQPPKRYSQSHSRDEKFEHFCDSCVFDEKKKKPKKKKKTNPLPPHMPHKKKKKNMQQKQGGKTNTTATTTTTTSSSKFNTNNANTIMVVRPRANNAHLFKKAR